MCWRGLVKSTVLCALVAGSAATWSRAAGLSVTAGVGYDFLSQRYFLDSITTDGSADSALAIWALRSTYLDDLKGTVATSWAPRGNRSLEFRASLEQTSDFLRLRSGGDWRIRGAKSRIDVSTELEWRNRFGQADTFGDSYLFGRTRTRASIPICGSLAGTGKLNLELVDFRSGATSASFDYARISGAWGLETLFPDASWGEINVLLSTRQVPDSLRMNYLTWGIEAVFLGFLPTGDLDLTARWEQRDYNRPGGDDDNRRFELYGRNRIKLVGYWFSRQEFDLEGMFYPAGAGIDGDHVRTGFSLLAGVEMGGVTVAAGPDVEHQWQRTSDWADSLGLVPENYFEAGAKLDLDYMGNGVFASLESVTGHRTLKYETASESSFWYQRVYILGDVRLFTVVNLSVLLSAEWERHREEQNNTGLYLFSSNLTYSF